MARRGPYAKGVAKREEILAAAFDLLARKGYSRTTVAELAEAVGLSQTGLLHYFGTKEELFTAVLRRRDELSRRRAASAREQSAAGSPPVPSAAELVTEAVRHDAEVPGLVQLSARFSAEASDPDHPAHEFFHDRYEASRAGAAEAVRGMQAVGRLPADLDPERISVLLNALTQGLQDLWIHDPDLDMPAHVAYFWELLGLTGPA